jgi:hypothetical protein
MPRRVESRKIPAHTAPDQDSWSTRNTFLDYGELARDGHIRETPTVKRGNRHIHPAFSQCPDKHAGLSGTRSRGKPVKINKSHKNPALSENYHATSPLPTAQLKTP